MQHFPSSLRSCIAIALLLASGTAADNAIQSLRDLKCDDYVPARADCGLFTSTCLSTELLAMRNGCYRCVDAITCEDPAQALPGAAPVRASPVSENQPENIVISDPDVHYIPIDQRQALNAQEAAAVKVEDLAFLPENGGNPASFTGPQGVSNWFFAAPVCLAMISIGLALRSKDPRNRRFHHLHDNDDHGDEINPFCENSSHHKQHNCDDDQEFAGICESDIDDLEYALPTSRAKESVV